MFSICLNWIAIWYLFHRWWMNWNVLFNSLISYVMCRTVFQGCWLEQVNGGMSSISSKEFEIWELTKTDGLYSMNLWHKRLGHPSLNITQLILEVRKHKDSNFRAKQTRKKFPLSEHKTSSAFELVIVIYGYHIELLLLVVLFIFWQ